jgi:midasin (ATPase involved in ribosome maturation)
MYLGGTMYYSTSVLHSLFYVRKKITKSWRAAVKKKQSIVATVFNIKTSRRGRKMPEVM